MTHEKLVKKVGDEMALTRRGLHSHPLEHIWYILADDAVEIVINDLVPEHKKEKEILTAEILELKKTIAEMNELILSLTRENSELAAQADFLQSNQEAWLP